MEVSVYETYENRETNHSGARRAHGLESGAGRYRHRNLFYDPAAPLFEIQCVLYG